MKFHRRLVQASERKSPGYLAPGTYVQLFKNEKTIHKVTQKRTLITEQDPSEFGTTRELKSTRIDLMLRPVQKGWGACGDWISDDKIGWVLDLVNSDVEIVIVDVPNNIEVAEKIDQFLKDPPPAPKPPVKVSERRWWRFW